MSTAATTAGTSAPVVAPQRNKIETPYPVVSASQISTYDAGTDGGCPRKWGFQYLIKLERPKGDAAALGDDVDTGQLQPLLMEGRALDLTRRSGPIAATGLPFLPPVKAPGLECQRHFVMPTMTGPGAGTDSALRGYQGYLDMWSPDSSIMPGLAPHPVDHAGRVLLVPLVGDFKTTGAWRYRKLPEHLLTDTQAMLYAKWATWFTGSKLVDLAWVYMRTKDKPKAERSYIRVDLEHIDDRFVVIETLAEEMFQARKAAPPYVQTLGDLIERDDPQTNSKEWADLLPARNRARLAANQKMLAYVETLQPNVQACDSFGGCAFRGDCNLSPDLIVDGLIASDRRRNGFKTKTNTETEPMTAPTTDAPQNKLLAKLAAKKAAADQAAGAAPVTGINPPESKIPPADPIGSVPVPDFEPTAEAAPAKGKPKKAAANKKAPAAEPATTTDDAPRIELVTFGSTKDEDEGTAYDVTWPEETFTNYGRGYRSPSITVSGRVQKGETLEQSMERTLTRIGVFVAKARLANKASFEAGWAEAPEALKAA